MGLAYSIEATPYKTFFGGAGHKKGDTLQGLLGRSFSLFFFFFSGEGDGWVGARCCLLGGVFTDFKVGNSL